MNWENSGLYVIAHDGGCEGHGLPMLAFKSRQKALEWIACQSESYSVALVPIFPDLPVGPWHALRALNDGDQP